MCIGVLMAIINRRVILFFLAASPLPIYAFGENLFASYHAHAAYASGDRSHARALFTRIAVDDPHDWRALYNLGTIALQDKAYADAIMHFDKVLELAPDNDSARERRAQAQALLDQQKEQEKQQQNSSEQDNNSAAQDNKKNTAQQSQDNTQNQQNQQGSDGQQDDGHQNNEQSGQKEGLEKAAQDSADQSEKRSEESAMPSADAQQEAERAAAARAAYEAAAQSDMHGFSAREQRLIELIEQSDERAQRNLLLQAYKGEAAKKGEAHVSTQRW